MEWLPPYQPSFECECNVGDAAIEEFDERMRAVREARAAERLRRKEAEAEKRAEAAEAAEAAAEEAAAAAGGERDARAADREAKRARLEGEDEDDVELPEKAGGDNKGDFAVWDDEKREMDAKTGNCNNLKEYQYKKKGAPREGYIPKRMSAGVLAMVASCGLFVSVKEMTDSESLQQVPPTPPTPSPLPCAQAPPPSQVHLFLYEVFARDRLPVPRVICYDDACHLLLFLKNRYERAEEFGYSKFAYWLLYLKSVKICCDRFHFKNHVGIWCKQNVNPADCVELGPRTNTMAAEEVRAPPPTPARAPGPRTRAARSRARRPSPGWLGRSTSSGR